MAGSAYSLLAPWIGGAGAGPAPVQTAGYRSLLGFWAGGYCVGPEAPIPDVDVPLSGGGGYHPWIHGPERRRVRIGGTVVEADVVEAIVESVTAVAARPDVVAMPAADTARVIEAMVERDLRDYLKSHEKQWAQEYAQLIALEYARQEEEMTTVVMLWFEM